MSRYLPSPFPSLVCALALALASSVLAQQQPVPSRGDAALTFNCPTRQTIDTAFFGYCPGQDNSGPARSLSGINVYTTYDDAPGSYQTQMDGLLLGCGYGDLTTASNCQYSAGGGTSLSSSDLGSCPAPPSTVPQPSGGGNYRRSTAPLYSRAVVNQRPKFVCPFTSSTSSIYVFETEIDSGRYAAENGQQFGVSSDEIQIRCGVRGETDYSCFYVQDSTGAIAFAGANPPTSADNCPTTLCDAITDGSGNMRRAVDSGVSASATLASRQVNTQTLRERMAAQRRVRRVTEGQV